MTVHYAAARTAAASPIARILSKQRPRAASNDNVVGVSVNGRSDDHLLHAALRHFAQHGLRAAHEARKQAENAFFAGDRESYRWWLGVCRTLDRRMATQMDQWETAD